MSLSLGCLWMLWAWQRGIWLLCSAHVGIGTGSLTRERNRVWESKASMGQSGDPGYHPWDCDGCTSVPYLRDIA